MLCVAILMACLQPRSNTFTLSHIGCTILGRCRLNFNQKNNLIKKPTKVQVWLSEHI